MAQRERVCSISTLLYVVPHFRRTAAHKEIELYTNTLDYSLIFSLRHFRTIAYLFDLICTQSKNGCAVLSSMCSFFLLIYDAQ